LVPIIRCRRSQPPLRRSRAALAPGMLVTVSHATRALECIFYYIRSPGMREYGGIWRISRDTAGYSGIQRDTAEYSGIQRDTAGYGGYSGIQRDAAGYSGMPRDTAGYNKIYSRARVMLESKIHYWILNALCKHGLCRPRALAAGVLCSIAQSASRNHDQPSLSKVTAGASRRAPRTYIMSVGELHYCPPG
jgi:hypothetical protein